MKDLIRTAYEKIMLIRQLKDSNPLLIDLIDNLSCEENIWDLLRLALPDEVYKDLAWEFPNCDFATLEEYLETLDD
jgi:hypothetical protein